MILLSTLQGDAKLCLKSIYNVPVKVRGKLLSNLLSQLLQWDGGLFYFFNHHLHNAFFDLVMPLITELGTGGAVWFAIIFILAVFTGGEGRKIAFLGTVALVVSFLISDEILKNLFARPRPFIHFPDTRLLVAAPYQYSFPSGHTTSSFAVAVSFFAKRRRLGLGALILASLIGVSRIYVGVHYPLDVLGGVVVGSVIGWLVVHHESALDKIVIKVQNILRRVKTMKKQLGK